MTWCSRRRGGTTAAKQSFAENTLNGSADLIRKCCVLKPLKNDRALVRRLGNKIGLLPARVPRGIQPIYAAVFPDSFIARTCPVVLGSDFRVSACEQMR
jgi:hypothetical protein